MSLLDNPVPDFSDPLGLLAACHQRMLGFCDLLERLEHWLESHGLDKDASDSAQSVVRYFSSAALLHHEDEELVLFPMLAGDPKLGALIDRLQREHRELEQLWASLARQLDRLLTGTYDQTGLHAAVTPFCSAYRRHIHDENSAVLPQAGRLLSDTQLHALGRSMQARRQTGHKPSTQ